VLDDRETLILRVMRDGKIQTVATDAVQADIHRVFPLQFVNRGVQEHLGQVVIHATRAPIRERQQRELGRLVALTLALNLTLILGLYIALRVIVLKPLFEVRDALQDIAAADADLSLRLPESHTVEFDGVADSFNGFVQRLQSVMGGTMDDVHAAIGRIARGNLDETIVATEGDSVMGRLALMQHSLRVSTEELREAKTAADGANQAKSNFLANMSHEIRTPLNAIIGMAYLAAKTETDPRQLNYVRKIEQSGKHLLGLINDILDFSKIEAGKLTLERSEFSLAGLLDSVVVIVQEKAWSKELELVVDIAPDVPWTLVGDSLRLGQVIINYCNNAVKFTEEGDIVLQVRPLWRTSEKVMLRFDVRDTGIGMNDAQMDGLFRSFSQADASTTRKYGGTGLGLVIAKSLAQLMGGDVGVASVVGQGSDFWFTAELGWREVPERGPQIASFRGARALVVDNNRHARQVLAAGLEAVGMVVQSVDCGQAALEAVQAAPQGLAPDWVFLDSRMPDMGGIAVAAALRTLVPAPLPAPQVVLVAAFGRDDELQAAAATGITKVLTKPVNAATLRETLLQAQESTPLAATGTSGTPDLATRLKRLAGARILLVDDNELNQEVALGLLEDVGLIVEVASNGQEAVDMVRAQDYDLVLMDMQMPVMGGVEATIEIRRALRRVDLPIVAMTANAMQQDLDRCRKAGMVDVVTKPISPERLWLALLQWTRVPAAAPVPHESAPAPVAGAAQDLSIPTNIAGLDTRLGLLRMAGKKALYLSALRRFAQNQENTGYQLAVTLEANPERAQRLAHTLKGLAGTIGANALQQAASVLEDAIRTRASMSMQRAALDTLAPMLASLVAQLHAGLAVAHSPPAPDAASALELPAVLTALATLFKEDDPGAVEFWLQHSGTVQAASPGTAAQISEALADYDFEGALHALQSLAPADPTTAQS
jgi:two-component system sensor histidine kinase/response regulator